MQAIVVIEQKSKLNQIASELTGHSDFTVCDLKQWKKYKKSYLISGEPIILLGDIVSQSDILGELREIRAFYQEVFLVKAHWKDYYKVKIKNWLQNLYEAI